MRAFAAAPQPAARSAHTTANPITARAPGRRTGPACSAQGALGLAPSATFAPTPAPCPATGAGRHLVPYFGASARLCQW